MKNSFWNILEETQRYLPNKKIVEKYLEEKTTKKVRMRPIFIKIPIQIEKVTKRNTLNTQNGCFHFLSRGNQGLSIPLKVTISSHFLIQFKALHPKTHVLFFSNNEVFKSMCSCSKWNNVLKSHTHLTFSCSKSVMEISEKRTNSVQS